MKDYSQGGEQAAILDALYGPATPQGFIGHFLDIGAWHHSDKSNVRALYELGWDGIVIEPSPGPLKGLIQAFGYDPRVKVIGAAVTCEGGLIELRATDDAVTAAPQSASERTWSEKGGYYGYFTTPSISVAELFRQFGGGFDMVSIDTEGTSVDLFTAMIAVGVRPRCVVVEHNDRLVELAGVAQAASYRQLLLNGENVVLQWTSGL